MLHSTFPISAPALAFGLAAAPVQAGTRPSKPIGLIRLIVDYPPGGPVDGIVRRLMMPFVGKKPGQAVVLANRGIQIDN